jgi:Rrf2 family protein
MSSLLGVSQKCQYALRALFELALRYPADTVMTVTDISLAQSIPPRFLEQILSKLRAGGYVESRRGNQGGYVMTVSPSSISVGEIIRFVEGADESVDCLKKPESNHCPFNNTCVFRDLWQRAKSSVSDVFDATTFQDLVDKHRQSENHSDYSI